MGQEQVGPLSVPWPMSCMQVCHEQVQAELAILARSPCIARS